MARPIECSNEALIKFADLYKLELGDDKLKITDFCKYLKEQGINIKPYSFNRPQYKKAKDYIDKLNKQNEDEAIATVVHYKELDYQSVIAKKNIKEIEEIWAEREKYFRRIAMSATYAIEESKRLKAYNTKLLNQFNELKAKLDELNQTDALKEEIDRLQNIIDNLVYPAIAQKIIDEDRNPTVESIIKSIPSLKIDEITSKSVKELLGDFDD